MDSDSKLPKSTLLLLFAILSVRMLVFMSYPFLSIYLERRAFPPMIIGWVIGMRYFSSGIGGIFTGGLSDRWGQKKTIRLSLFAIGLAFCLMAFASKTSTFLLLNIVIGLGLATFEPAASSLITIITPLEKVALAFRYRHLAINIGMIVSPLFGVMLSNYNDLLAFQLTGVSLMLLILFISRIYSEEKITQVSFLEYAKTSKKMLRYMAGYKSFLYLVCAGFFTSIAYCQMTSTFPLLLNAKTKNGLEFYSILLSVNSITVIFIGLLFSQILSKCRLKDLFAYGCTLLMISFIGLEIAPFRLLPLIILMMLFTIGEVLIMPTSSKYMGDLAPKEYRAAFYGAEGINHLGSFFGSLLGGAFIQREWPLFGLCAMCSLIGLFCYLISLKNFQPSKNLTTEIS